MSLRLKINKLNKYAEVLTFLNNNFEVHVVKVSLYSQIYSMIKVMDEHFKMDQNSSSCAIIWENKMMYNKTKENQVGNIEMTKYDNIKLLNLF